MPLASLVSTAIALSLAGHSLLAAESQWDCRVSADGNSWDCYKDGTLVMQPMPQSSRVVTTPATAVAVPDTSEIVEVPEESPQKLTESLTPEQPPEKTPPAVEAAGAAVTAKTPEAEPEISKPAEQTPVAITEPVESETAPAIAAEPEPEPEPIPDPAEAMPTSPDEEKLVQEPPATEPQVTSPEKPEPPAQQPAVETEESSAVSSATRAAPAQSMYCDTRPTKIQRSKIPASGLDTDIAADDAVIDDASGIADFQGNVILQRGDQTVRSDALQYNSNTQDVIAEGSLRYERPDLSLQGQSASMNLDTETGEINQASYRLPGNNARGEADQLSLAGEGVTQYKNASYTTCAPGNNDWILNAGEVQIDQNTGVGTAKDVKLMFKDMPIAYLPTATFPIDDRRKSGFLLPSIGNSDSTGFDLSVPYYFNLAPNYDATLTPRLMSERGIMLGGQFRYLDQLNNAVLQGEFLPDDNEYIDNDPRGAASLDHRIQVNPRLRADLDLNYVSDKDYLEDFGNSLALASTKHLERTASIRYNGGFYSLSGVLQEYQTVDKTIASALEPYKKLPQLTLKGDRLVGDTDFIAALQTQYTYFDHEDDSKAKAGRFDIMPSITYDWRRSWGFLKPKASVRYTSYALDDHTTDSVDRTTSTVSLDGGLIFERAASWFGTRSTQTLEPRLFYVYTPDEDQSDIPLFDSDEYTFGTASLFRENRFSGADRVGDANQLTLALSSRFFSDQTSREFLGLTVGQIYYFEDRSVQLDYTSPNQKYSDDSSSFVVTLNSHPAKHWSADAGLQWDPDFEDTEKAALRVKYADDNKRLFSFRYQLDEVRSDGTVLEYTKLSAYWPVAFNTRLVGHSYYSLEEDRAIETVAGIEHGSSCCWRFRALAREYQVNADQDTNLSFLLQLELTGFTRLGDDIDSFLEQTIDGFVRED